MIGASLSAVFRLALLIAVAAGTARAETGSAAGPAVLFVKGWGAETNRTLLVPVVCYRPGVGLVSGATSDCLSLVAQDAEVSLDSGATLRVSGRETAACTGDDGEPTGARRESLVVSGDPGEFTYAVWPPSGRALIRPIGRSHVGSWAGDIPAREASAIGRLVRRHARGEIDVLQRFEADLDGDGQVDVAYSVDVRCTRKEMRARTRCADCEPWSCFNGLLVRWGGSPTFALVAKDWNLGQVGAVFDFEADKRPEILVFASLDEGFRAQVFSVEKRKLKPLEPWCCGCVAEKKGDCRPARR